MKITVLSGVTSQPLQNSKLHLFIKGRDNGKLTIITDEQGCFLLNDNFQDHQLSISVDGQPGQWATAREGVRLIANDKETSKV